MNNCFVYRHIRLDTNMPFYIGVGKQKDKYKTDKWFYERAFVDYNRNSIWERIAAKTEYKVQIVLDNLSKEDACIKEIELIALYGRICDKSGTLANLSTGGELTAMGVVHGEEFRKKIGDRLRGKKRPKEVGLKISASQKGKKISEEQKVRLRFHAHNFWTTEERAKASERAKKQLTPEMRKRISETLKGKMSGDKNPNFGKAMSAEQKAKVSASKKGTQAGANNPSAKKVINTITGEVFGCAKEVAIKNNLNYKTFAGKLSGRRKNNTKYEYL